MKPRGFLRLVKTERPIVTESASQEQAEPMTKGLDGYLDQLHLTRIFMHLTELKTRDPAAFKRTNIDIRQRRIHDASPEELYTWLNRSTQSDWQTHPSFYAAIIAELKERSLLPRPRV